MPGYVVARANWSDELRSPPPWPGPGGGLPLSPGEILNDQELKDSEDHRYEVWGGGRGRPRHDADPATAGLNADLVIFQPSLQELPLSAEAWLHRIEDARGPINLDFYPVYIERLPVLNGREMKPTEFLDLVRGHLGDFIDKDVARFTFYDKRSLKQWASPDPIGAVMRFDIGSASWNLNAGIEGASVVVTRATDLSWTFSTVHTEEDHGHPVSGNREFGLATQADGSYVLYTRGADRATSWIDSVLAVDVFGGADACWISFQRGATDWVNEHGGTATVGERVWERHDWDEVAEAAATDDVGPGFDMEADANSQKFDMDADRADGQFDMDADLAAQAGAAVGLADVADQDQGFDVEADAASQTFDATADAASGQFDMAADIATQGDATAGVGLPDEAGDAQGFDMESDAASRSFDAAADGGVGQVDMPAEIAPQAQAEDASAGVGRPDDTADDDGPRFDVEADAASQTFDATADAEGGTFNVAGEIDAQGDTEAGATAGVGLPDSGEDGAASGVGLPDAEEDRGAEGEGADLDAPPPGGE